MKFMVWLAHGILLVAAIGCSNKEPAPAPPAAASPPAAATAAAPLSPAPVPSPPPAAPSAPPAAIATADGQMSGVRAEVTELKRSSGGTLMLRFTIINDSNRPLQVADVGVGGSALIDGASYTIGGVHLIDLVGKKKYFVARDSGNACVCSRFGGIPAGSRANHWARFSAPPEDVDRMSIVIPSFSPIDDVPVSR